MGRVEVHPRAKEILDHGQKICCHCDKTFMVGYAKMYTYRLKVTDQSTRYFCCYTHYKAGQEKREAEIKKNKKAYVDRRFKRRK